MSHRTPLETHQEEVYKHGEVEEAQKYGFCPPLNEENMTKRVRIHSFHSPRLPQR